MRYLIDAWLESGIPQLRIRDAETGVVRLRWARASSSEVASNEENYERAASHALKRLFKELVLLSCIDKINLNRQADLTGFGEECLGCGECVTGGFDAEHMGRPDDVVDLSEWHRAIKLGEKC